MQTTAKASENQNQFFKGFNSAIDAIKSIPGYLYSGLTKTVEGLTSAANYVKDLATTSFNYLTGSGDKSLIGHMKKGWEKLNAGLETIYEKISNFVKNPVKTTKDFFTSVIDGLKSLLEGAGKLVGALYNKVIEKVKSIGSSIGMTKQ